jgi:two-component system sensor histidine kinase ChiS
MAHTQKNTVLNCIHKDGTVFASNASINKVDVMGDSGFAIVLDALPNGEENISVINDQRLDTVEQTLSGLLAFAKQNPESIQGIGSLSLQAENSDETDVYKSLLREQVVKVMNIALSCWEQDIHKTKIELAEESNIWPVYIDKSTPTTRTLDKYLNIDLCPKNPRSQRAVDTAEFVLREMGAKSPTDKCRELRSELEVFRDLIAGVKLTSK